MVNSRLLSLVVTAGLAIASAIPSAPQRRTLKPDEVVVIGGGREEIMSKTTYVSLTSQDGMAGNSSARAPAASSVSKHSSNYTRDHRLEKRGCKGRRVFILEQDKSIVGTDVPMSGVVNGQNKATVSVTKGYSVSNEINVSVNAQWKVTKIFLEASFSTSYTRTWSSQHAAAYTFEVPKGKYGVVVSNPLITRRTGRVGNGCIGHQTSATFEADELSSMAMGEMSWVQGAISLCTGDTYPVPKCSGEGFLS
ncbi:hypothetical protein PZA11_000864 [Diplocarpon coronariae]